MAYVSARPRQGLTNQKLLDFFETHLLNARCSARAAAQRQIARFDTALLRHQHRTLDHMIQLAHIALPGVLLERLRGVWIEARDVLPIPPSVHPKEVGRERRDIFLSLPQRRQM